MDKCQQVIIDNIKKEPELIIDENEDDLEATKKHKEQCDHTETKELIDDRVLCNFCNKLFGSLQILKIHQKFHHNDIVYNCHECSFKTKYYSNLLQHRDSIHLNVYHHKCQFCEKKFKDHSNKNRHVRTVHKTSVHYCTICNEKFSRKDNVNLHMKRIHGISKIMPSYSLFKCDHCGLTYTTKINLLKHMQKVHL